MEDNPAKEPISSPLEQKRSGAEPLVHHWNLAEDGGALRDPSSYSSPEEGIHKPSKSARTISWPESNPRPGSG